jgi:disulfide bond formation protein DsbB
MWIQSLIATTGSLYFSDVLKYTPCTLCWYQRIFMYPLVILIPLGIIKKDKTIVTYVQHLSALGIAIASYHNLLYLNILPESNVTCAMGISCTTKYVEYFGFLTIPLMSFIAFFNILLLTFIYNRRN